MSNLLKEFCIHAPYFCSPALLNYKEKHFTAGLLSEIHKTVTFYSVVPLDIISLVHWRYCDKTVKEKQTKYDTGERSFSHHM